MARVEFFFNKIKALNKTNKLKKIFEKLKNILEGRKLRKKDKI